MKGAAKVFDKNDQEQILKRQQNQWIRNTLTSLKEQYRSLWTEHSSRRLTTLGIGKSGGLMSSCLKKKNW